MNSRIEREKIIDNSGKLLDNLVCALRATKNHFLKTQKKELQTQIAYSLKAKKIDSDRKQVDSKELTLEKYVSMCNLFNAYDNCKESSFLTKMIPGSIVVSAISTLDYYIFQLLHTLLDYDPNLWDSIDVKLPYKDLRDLENTADIREYYVSTFIEALFLGSHDGLFDDISKKFNLKSIKDLHGYKDFLFVTELRNIIVHHDARISLKFRLNMEKYKINIKKYDFFDQKGYLALNPDNIKWVIDVCLSIALQFYLKVCEHYSRKNAKITEKYTLNINSVCVDLISSGYSNACCTIYDVLLTNKKYSENYYLYCINKALCLKKMGKLTEMQEFLDTITWTDGKEEYICAKHILLDEYDLAVEYMDKVDLLEWDCGYQNWPLCTSFVKSTAFKAKYETIYGHKYEKKTNKGKLSEEEVLKIIEDYEKDKHQQKKQI